MSFDSVHEAELVVSMLGGECLLLLGLRLGSEGFLLGDLRGRELALVSRLPYEDGSVRSSGVHFLRGGVRGAAEDALEVCSKPARHSASAQAVLVQGTAAGHEQVGSVRAQGEAVDPMTGLRALEVDELVSARGRVP